MKKFLFSQWVVCLTIVCTTMYAQKNMTISDKKIDKTILLHQSLDSVWYRWTTPEGLKTFFGVDNKMELRNGGTFEIYFLQDAPKGSKGSEGCTVLSYLPQQMLSFSWNAPPQFKDIRASSHQTWVVVNFIPIAPNETRVNLHHYGWPTDTKWNPVFDYFNNAWDVVLKSLAKHDAATTTISIAKAKVTGLGGIFFKSRNPEALKAWYSSHLGLVVDKYGTNFEWRLATDSSKKGFTQWSAFSDKTKYFEPSTREFMINYRVGNLEQLYEQFKKEGVTICDKIETYDYGKFLHIMDIEGNKIELWEPIDEVYEKGVNAATK